MEKAKQRNDQKERLVKDLGEFAQSAKMILTSVQEQSRVLKEIYGSSERFELETFVNLGAPVTVDTFPRFVTFFLNQADLPPVLNAVPGTTVIFDVIPREKQFKLVSALLHPDKNPNKDISVLQNHLNNAFDKWRPILELPHLSTVILHEDNDESAERFCAQGEEYKELSFMYYCYMVAVNEARDMLSPTTLSLWDYQGAGRRTTIIGKWK